MKIVLFIGYLPVIFKIEKAQNLFAVVSDIHSNIEAFDAVLADIKSKNINTIYCLGDIVGYGPNPLECTRKVADLCKFSIVGNHDYALVENSAWGFNKKAIDAIEYTRKVMSPGFFSSFFGDKKRLWAYLKNMQKVQKVEHFTFVHGSPLDPVFEYVTYEDADHLGFGYVKDFEGMFKEFDHICFNGHTHRPLVIVQEKNEYKAYRPEDIDGQYQIQKDVKALINAGSVGQPRDGNPHACYLTVNDDKLVQYHRIPYDIEKTAQKIYAIAELHDALGKRLFAGE